MLTFHKLFDQSDEKGQAHSKASALSSNWSNISWKFDIQKTELGKPSFGELDLVLFVKIVSL